MRIYARTDTHMGQPPLSSTTVDGRRFHTGVYKIGEYYTMICRITFENRKWSRNYATARSALRSHVESPAKIRNGRESDQSKRGIHLRNILNPLMMIYGLIRHLFRLEFIRSGQH